MIEKILITGGGAPGAPGIINALRLSTIPLHLVSCDVQANTVGTLLTDESFQIVSGDNETYTQDLLKECITRGITSILPITTKELMPLSSAIEEFKRNGIHILVSEPTALHIANDKGLLYSHLQKKNIDTPKFQIVETYSEFIEARNKLKQKGQPYIIKPCVSNGTRGFRIVSDKIDQRDLLFNHKPNSQYIEEQRLDNILKDGFPTLLVSEYMPGQEYTVDCFMNDGEIKLIIPRTRDKMNNGISVAGTIERNEEIIEYCKKILGTLKLHGPIGIQVKYSLSGKPLVVEINPRIQGTTVACIGAGVNIPLIALSKKHCITDSRVNTIPIAWGTKFIRYYSELYY